jgi:hypothetical protein
MNGWRGNYIKAFILMIGLALVFSGITLSQFLGDSFNAGSIFIILGVIFLAVIAYFWYRDFRKGL